MTFAAGIHEPQRLNLSGFGDPVTFALALFSGQISNLRNSTAMLTCWCEDIMFSLFTFLVYHVIMQSYANKIVKRSNSKSIGQIEIMTRVR